MFYNPLSEKQHCNITEKVKFNSKKEARAASKSLKDISPYKCKYCHTWHITTKRNKFYNDLLPSSFKRIARTKHSGRNSKGIFKLNGYNN